MPAAKFAAPCRPMPDVPLYWHEAKAHLKRQDKVLGAIISAYPLVKLRLKKDSFTTLARAITGQQISVKAADTIWARFVAASAGRTTHIKPKKVIAMKLVDLRACGFSERKANYIQNLAERFAAKEISGRKLARMQDSQIRETLISLHGIGPWTADMYMMFNLWRPDVLPLGDVGLIRAVELHYFNGKKTGIEKIRQAAAPWAPFSTVATWYLWRSLDPVAVEY